MKNLTRFGFAFLLSAGIVFVQGKRPAAEVVDQARSRDLPLIATKMTMFEACSRMAGQLEDGGHVRR